MGYLDAINNSAKYPAASDKLHVLMWSLLPNISIVYGYAVY
jgi:hypothetical protein